MSNNPSSSAPFALDFADVQTFGHRFDSPESALAAQLRLRGKLARTAATAQKSARELSIMASALTYNAVLNGVLGRSAQKDAAGKAIKGTAVDGIRTQANYAAEVGLSHNSIPLYLNCGQALVKFGVDPASDAEILPARNIDGDMPVTHALLWSWLFGKSKGASKEVAGWLRANPDSSDLVALAELVRSVTVKAKPADGAGSGEDGDGEETGAAGGTVQIDEPSAILKRLQREADVIRASVAAGKYGDEAARTALLAVLVSIGEAIRSVGNGAKDEAPAAKPGPRKAPARKVAAVEKIPA
jgi:hypothetical protein